MIISYASSPSKEKLLHISCKPVTLQQKQLYLQLWLSRYFNMYHVLDGYDYHVSKLLFSP